MVFDKCLKPFVILKMVLSVIGVLTLTSPAQAASFDCRAATHISDVTICRYAELSSLEEGYVTDYQTLISRGGNYVGIAKQVASQQMRERRQCEDNAPCIERALRSARTVLGASLYDDQTSGTVSTSPQTGGWEQLEPLPVPQLISLWHRLNNSCRGGTTEMHIGDCTTREEVSDYLGQERNWCYGREGEAGYEHTWHVCEPGSYGYPKFTLANKNWDTVIRLVGETNEGSLTSFLSQAATARGDVIVSLEGPGGSVNVGVRIAEIIQDRGYATIVEAGSECASICSVMFLSGHNRYLSRFGTVLVHSSYDRNNSVGSAQRSFSGNEKMTRVLRRAGVPNDMIYYVMTGDPDSYFPISPEIARNMNLQFTEF